MVKSIFVTATGTDIGKTYVSGLIVKKMRNFGLDCGYFKPVLSGLTKNTDNTFTPGDCEHVLNVSGINIDPFCCLSYSFEEAVSPHLAADRLGIKIRTEKIIDDYKKLSEGYDYMLIEGAGGITCPIREDSGKYYLMSDLIKDMGQSVIVVADGGLGTINSVLTTFEYAKNHGINVKGFIFNNYDSTNFMHRDNLKMVEKLTQIDVLATVPKDETDLNISKQDLISLFE